MFYETFFNFHYTWGGGGGAVQSFSVPKLTSKEATASARRFFHQTVPEERDPCFPSLGPIYWELVLRATSPASKIEYHSFSS